MELDQDFVMLKLKEMVLRGRPDKISDVDQDLQAYWNFRDELCICDGLLMKGNRLITPPSLWKEMLDKLTLCQYTYNLTIPQFPLNHE